MRHLFLIGGAGTIGVLILYLFAAKQRTPEQDTIEKLLAFSPTPQEIQSQITGMSHASQESRRAKFVELFNARFRSHDLRIAVLARYVAPIHGISQIRLLCPARTEPWNMDRLALAFWRESKTNLNENCDIDIYETFIGAPPRKIGELRADPIQSKIAHLRFTPAPLKAQQNEQKFDEQKFDEQKFDEQKFDEQKLKGSKEPLAYKQVDESE